VPIVRRKLDPTEKLRIGQEQLEVEKAAFPETNITVVVDDYTYANGEPQVRVIAMSKRVSDGPH
jgi:hypothetical protein